MLLALLLAGCDGNGTDTVATSSSPPPATEAPEFPQVAKVALSSPEDLAAVAPFGLMRVAVAHRSLDRGIGFRHARVAGSPDLLLSVQNVSAAAGSSASGLSGVLQDPGRKGVVATPGRVVAILPEQGLVAEATTRERLAVYRVTVAEGDALTLRLAWESSGQVPGQWSPARGRQALNGVLSMDDGASLHAAVRFDQSFTELASEPGSSLLRFSPPGGVLHIRIALSTTDLAGARANLADGAGLGFEGVLRSTQAAWDNLLGRITVDASEQVRVRMATDWYRVLALYGRLEDRDGRFRAPDGSIRQVAPGKAYIGNLELSREQWTVLPLLDLLATEHLRGLPDTLLLHQRVTGRFPGHTAWGLPHPGPTNPEGESAAASVVLAGFVSRSGSEEAAQRVLPPVIKASREHGYRSGYVPFDVGPAPSVSRTLTRSRSAQAIAVIAAAAGDRETAGAFAARAVFYRLLYDSDVGAFRGRDRAGRWRSPFPPNPDQAGGREDYTGGRWAESLWTAALFDIDGLLELLGGQQQLEERLDAAFSAEAGFAGVDAGETSLQHTPWLYGFTNHPERIRERLGLSGPLHAASGASAAAWRLFRDLGLYPVLPADGEYMMVPPAVPEARLEIPGQVLRLVSPGKGPGSWRGGVHIDGQPQPGRLMSHQRLVGGGVVTYEIGSDD